MTAPVLEGVAKGLRDGRLVVSNTADRSLSRLAPATLPEEARPPSPPRCRG